MYLLPLPTMSPCVSYYCYYYDLHNIKFSILTILKGTIQRYLVHSLIVQPLSVPSSSTFSLPHNPKSKPCNY